MTNAMIFCAGIGCTIIALGLAHALAPAPASAATASEPTCISSQSAPTVPTVTTTPSITELLAALPLEIRTTATGTVPQVQPKPLPPAVDQIALLIAQSGRGEP